MCLTALKLEIKIAEKNILCYKRLTKSGKSEINLHFYEKGVRQPDVELIKSKSYSGGDESIEKGYHSRMINSKSPKEHLFIIPKGAKYAEGGENNTYRVDGYVSSSIIYEGRNNFFNRLKVKFKYLWRK